MSWGKRPGGGTFGPVKDVDELGRSKGLDKSWYSNKQHKWKSRRGEIKKGNFWDIIDNPLYQVAAEAQGYDWDDWIKDAKGKVGKGPDHRKATVRAVVKEGSSATRRVHTGAHPDGRSGPSVRYETYTTKPEYEWMTRAEAEEGGYDYDTPETTRYRNKETGEIVTAQSIDRSGSERDEWEEVRDWGVYDIGVSEDLDEMQKWLADIVNVNDHLPKIIREGPKGEWYGLPPGTDVWEHYGLDEEPEPPKELEWEDATQSDDWIKKEAIRSEVTYSTPQGITPVNLHGD